MGHFDLHCLHWCLCSEGKPLTEKIVDIKAPGLQKTRMAVWSLVYLFVENLREEP